MNHEVDHKDDDYDNHNDLGDGDSEDDHLEPQQPKKMSLLWYLIVFTLAIKNLVFQHLPQHQVSNFFGTTSICHSNCELPEPKP